ACDAFRDGAERDERRLRRRSDDACERRLPRARRAPEDDAADLVLLDQLAQRTTRPEQMRLTDELVGRAWTHARGEWRGSGLGLLPPFAIVACSIVEEAGQIAHSKPRIRMSTT